MPKLHRWIMFCSLLIITSASYGNEYKGYIKLNPDECVPLSKEVVISQLPADWHHSAGFVKICQLKQKKTTATPVSIISIWVLDYYDAKFPPPATRKGEKFPLPIVVDNEFHTLGQLPQQYPDDPPRELNIYYSEFQAGTMSEILIDVYNPAVSGDYYYAPFRWNKQDKIYEMESKSNINGRRPY